MYAQFVRPNTHSHSSNQLLNKINLHYVEQILSLRTLFFHFNHNALHFIFSFPKRSNVRLIKVLHTAINFVNIFFPVFRYYFLWFDFHETPYSSVPIIFVFSTSFLLRKGKTYRPIERCSRRCWRRRRQCCSSVRFRKHNQALLCAVNVSVKNFLSVFSMNRIKTETCLCLASG